jgi:hypothetical protein
MVHVLSGHIFDSSAAKATVARVMGAWPDLNGYYTSQQTRYLVMRKPGNGLDFTPLRWGSTGRGDYGYMGPPQLQGYFTFAVALARRLGRVLTLPILYSKEDRPCIAESVVNVSVLDALVEWRESTFWRHELVQSSNISTSVRTIDATPRDPCQMNERTGCKKPFVGCQQLLAKVFEEARQSTDRVLELDLLQSWGHHPGTMPFARCFEDLLSHVPTDWWPNNVPHAQAMVTQGLFKCNLRRAPPPCPTTEINTGNVCV